MTIHLLATDKATKMPPKRKASASKGSDTKKHKRESTPAKDTVTTAETAEVWFSVEHW